VTARLGRLRLDSIRNKILAFAVLATVIPSLATAWYSYIQNKKSLTEKTIEQLQSVGSQSARELDLWMKELLVDLRVFSSSYEVTENLNRGPSRFARLTDFLESVSPRFPDYEELIVVDPRGNVLATTAKHSRPIVLPTGWEQDIRQDNPAIGQPYWDSVTTRLVMIVAVPIRLTDGRLLGALTGRINLKTVKEILTRFSPSEGGQLYITNEHGRLLTSSRGESSQLMSQSLSPGTVARLLGKEGTATQYSDFEGTAVVGTLKRVTRMRWDVVVEVPASEAYGQVIKLRNTTGLIVLGVLIVVGAFAYVLGLLIVRPLDRLTRGAAEVAAGDLAVDLPVVGGGEVGYLTKVFNHMVARLREGRQQLDQINAQLRAKNEELARLSITDGLTGLSNRRHLMEVLTIELHRARRTNRSFSVLMADVDHFKKYNDANGHLAGDEVLKRVGAILRESARTVDCSARYGGEEFFVLLPDTTLDGAAEFADRIRARLVAEPFPGGTVTLSIGIAEFPAHGDTPDAVIASADAALYRAKREGRDRVTRASQQRLSKEPKQA
jgi:diguanylate cyclase (GGDEF)-like protein